ncbi:RlpA-like double-psi beta-barrel domain-containing protein [Aspergillus stella-maris]|uniref:RlpA-like double-psi beta-barrel domain-containing protein n=1 Tax=Aspergillus stella-maris TaxID=1810926 RepID=UPI003CCD19AC
MAMAATIIGLAVGLTRGSKGSNLPLPTSNGGPYTGDLTYYDPGLGSCGITSTSSEKICAVSHTVFDAALTSGNPNENPLCGLKLRIRRGESSVDVTVVDRCPGCEVDDLDVSSSVFEELGDLAEGRVTVQWAWLEEMPIEMGEFDA